MNLLIFADMCHWHLLSRTCTVLRRVRWSSPIWRNSSTPGQHCCWWLQPVGLARWWFALL